MSPPVRRWPGSSGPCSTTDEPATDRSVCATVDGALLSLPTNTTATESRALGALSAHSIGQEPQAPMTRKLIGPPNDRLSSRQAMNQII